MKRRVVITGIGVIASCGIGKEEFWEKSISGKSFCEAYNDFSGYDLQSRVVGKVNNYNYTDFDISDEDADRTGRHTQFALVCTQEAIEDAQIDLTKINNERFGVCIANAIADTPYSEYQFLKIKNFFDENQDMTKEQIDDLIHQDLFSKAMFNCLSTEIAAKYNCKGNVFTMSTGCTGGIDAVGYAYESILNDEVDIMICGASEAPISCMTISSFDVIGATSVKNEFPEKASSPFDSTRDGFVLAEGCGIVILEEYDHARKRNAKIYGEILSFATKNNAVHMTDLPGDGEPLVKVFRLAIEEAGIKNTDIDYINAHGSSTPQNDLCESSAYKEVFGDYAYQLPISSTKSIVGHPLGAASAVEIVHCCLILERKIMPPTVNLDHPDPLCDLDYIPNKAREKDVKIILTDASGFSGIHSAMIIKRLEDNNG